MRIEIKETNPLDPTSFFTLYVNGRAALIDLTWTEALDQVDRIAYEAGYDGLSVYADGHVRLRQRPVQ